MSIKNITETDQKTFLFSGLNKTQNKSNSYNIKDLSGYKVNFQNEENREYFLYLLENHKKLLKYSEDLNNQLEVLNLQNSEISIEINEFFR